MSTEWKRRSVLAGGAAIEADLRPFMQHIFWFKGEGDLRGELGLIDTAKCPVWLLTGDYDYSCPPGATREAASGIPGASVAIMERLGHFPMSENYPLFRTHLLPVLDQVVRSIAAGR